MHLCQESENIAHHAVDKCEDLPKEVPQSAQVQGGVFLSVGAVGLAPRHRFVQPEPHLPGVQQGPCRRSDLDRRLRHSATCPGGWTEDRSKITIKCPAKAAVKITRLWTRSTISSTLAARLGRHLLTNLSVLIWTNPVLVQTKAITNLALPLWPCEA
ncbi:hypothetical protein EYF80_024066 [Liparis tanakae]|uniref:Uncharacterized protein n=1 Tax=Liparis tanakae TaxID=230148 RepID=A0A4Z2HL99_9TELE|nr:hypothetical protein EYF80_024066 [Liparis tanakae]